MPRRYPPVLAGGEVTASGFPEPFFCTVFPGARRFRALAAFPPFLDFDSIVRSPFPAVPARRLHFRVPRAFA